MATSNIKRLGIPAALVVGGITAGSFFAPLGLASAQDDTGDTDTDTETDSGSTDTDDSAENDSADSAERQGRRGHRHGGLGGDKGEVLADALGMTTDEIREAFADGQSVADMAEAQGVDLAEVEAALVAEATERIEAAVADGKIDEDRAAEMIDGLADKIGEMVNADRSEMGPRGEGHGRKARGGSLGGSHEELSELLGLSGEEIRTALAGGQSLADLATEQGVELDAVTDLLVAGIEERIDQAVENGRIDAEEADEKLAEAEERVDDMVNATIDDLRERFGDRGGRRGHHGPRGDRGATADADSASDIEESSF